MYMSFVRSSQAKALLEVRRSNCSHTLADRLLSALCDCTVHLDSELHISKPCPHLANLLLRPSAASMLGQQFVTLLPDVEQERFARYVAEEVMPQSSSGSLTEDLPARVLHLHLLDANGVLVPGVHIKLR